MSYGGVVWYSYDQKKWLTMDCLGNVYEYFSPKVEAIRFWDEVALRMKK